VYTVLNGDRNLLMATSALLSAIRLRRSFALTVVRLQTKTPAVFAVICINGLNMYNQELTFWLAE